jgi:hypothetical protein
MKITKRQLRRIIKEERAKLRKEAIDPDLPMGNYEDPDGGMMPGQEELWMRANEDLENDFKNAITNAKDNGLLADDINTAFREVLTQLGIPILRN